MIGAIRLEVSWSPRLVSLPHGLLVLYSPPNWSQQPLRAGTEECPGQEVCPSSGQSLPFRPDAKALFKMKGNCAIPQGRGERLKLLMSTISVVLKQHQRK